MQERLIIETTNLELQKELLSKEKNEFQNQSQQDAAELAELQEYYAKLVKDAKGKEKPSKK